MATVKPEGLGTEHKVPSLQGPHLGGAGLQEAHPTPLAHKLLLPQPV